MLCITSFEISKTTLEVSFHSCKTEIDKVFVQVYSANKDLHALYVPNSKVCALLYRASRHENCIYLKLHLRQKLKAPYVRKVSSYDINPILYLMREIQEWPDPHQQGLSIKTRWTKDAHRLPSLH